MNNISIEYETEQKNRFHNASKNTLAHTSLVFLNYLALTSGITNTPVVNKVAITLCSLAAIINTMEMVDSKKRLDTISRNRLLLDEDIVIEERPKVLRK